MNVRHLFGSDNGAITEATYEHDGAAACARLLGHMNAEEAAATLDGIRLRARAIADAEAMSPASLSSNAKDEK